MRQVIKNIPLIKIRILKNNNYKQLEAALIKELIPCQPCLNIIL